MGIGYKLYFWEGEIWGSKPPVCSDVAYRQITLAVVCSLILNRYYSAASHRSHILLEVRFILCCLWVENRNSENKVCSLLRRQRAGARVVDDWQWRRVVSERRTTRSQQAARYPTSAESAQLWRQLPPRLETWHDISAKAITQRKAWEYRHRFCVKRRVPVGIDFLGVSTSRSN